MAADQKLFAEVQWYNHVTTELDARNCIVDQLSLGKWLNQCRVALDRYYPTFDAMKSDFRFSDYEVKKFGHYWYIQEFKYNRLVEKKQFWDLLISRLRSIEERAERVKKKLNVLAVFFLNTQTITV